MSDLEAEGGVSVARGRCLVLAAAVLWSLSGVFTKLLGDLDFLQIAFYRSAFAGLVLLPLVPWRRWVFRPVMGLSAVAFAAMIGLYIGAVQKTSAANAIFLQCTATFWLIPFSVVLLREWPDRRSVLGVGLATLGIAAIVLFGYEDASERVGIAMGLASGVAYASVVIGLRGLRRLDPIWLSAVNNLGGALVLGAGIGMARGPIPVPESQTLLALASFGIVQMAIPYALFARGLRAVPASEAGLLVLLEPVLNPIWVLMAVGERPEPATLVGGLFLLSGVACRFWPRPVAVSPTPTTPQTDAAAGDPTAPAA